ncbi:hypothetical protein AAC387_Pa04g2268 [Persea americana]
MKTRSIETPKPGATKKTPPKKESENPPSKSEQEESSTTKATQVKSPPSTGAKAVKKIVKKATPKSAAKPEPKVEEIAPTSDALQATSDSTPVSTAKSTEKKIVRKRKSPSVVKVRADDSTKNEAPAMQVEKEDEQKSVVAQTEEKEKEKVKEGQKIIEDAKEPETTNTVKIEEENPAENPIGEDEYGAEGEDYGGEEKFEEPGDEEYAQDDLSEPEEVEEEDGQMEEEQMQMSDLAKERKLKKAQEIFVGGLDRDAVEDDVKKVFEKIGEVLEVRLHRNLQTNKNKGFAFVKFANQEQASRALSELKSPVIRGKQCGVAPSEDNDTLFLGNICNTWTKEAIKRKLKEYGVEGVENITLVADAQHEGLSRGFAFIEFSCHADAMLAYKRLQKPDVIFGHPERTVKVAFAEPLREPDPEIMAQVKSVFVDGLPPHWDEDRVRDQFKGYGEIERVVLARNMATAKRKDFGFVDFTTHEDAIACIECVNNTELGDGKTKVKVKARLSNPLPKTQAVKGGMRGGFRIRHPAVGFGRGFVHAKRPLDRGGFERGRAFHPRGRGRMGRFSQADGHDFGGRRPFRGRGHFGGRRGSFGRSTYDNEFVTRSATSSRFDLDRPRAGALDIGHAETFQYGRHPFPERDYGRPFGGRHFDDSYEYDGAGSGLKRTFSMMDDESGYLESGSRLRPRYDFPDPVSHRTHYRDTIGNSGGLYPHDYYGSDYGGSAYSSLYEDEYSVGRRYYY